MIYDHVLYDFIKFVCNDNMLDVWEIPKLAQKAIGKDLKKGLKIHDLHDFIDLQHGHIFSIIT